MSNMYAQEYKAFKEVLGDDSVTAVDKGPLFHENYFTCKLKIQAPDDSRIDIAGYTVVLALPLKSYKPSKAKVGVSGKDLPSFFLEALAKQITAMIGELGVVSAVGKLETEFDMILLKLWSFFERYQHYEGTTTILRYQLRQEPPGSAQDVLTGKSANKDANVIANSATKTPTNMAMAIAMNTDTATTSSTERHSSKQEKNNTDTTEDKINSSKPPNTNTRNTNKQPDLIKISSGDTISVNITKPKELRFIALSEFRTIGEYYADLYSRISTVIPEALCRVIQNKTACYAMPFDDLQAAESTAAIDSTRPKTVESAPLSTNAPWTEADSTMFAQIFKALLGNDPIVKPVDAKISVTLSDGKQLTEIKGIYSPLTLDDRTVNPRCLLTTQLLKLGRYFFDYGFTLLKVTKDVVLAQFNFPFTLLTDSDIDEMRSNFPSLCKSILEIPTFHLPLVVNFDLRGKSKVPLINPDPKHTMLQTVQAIAKRDISIEYNPDKYDYDVLHYLTICINVVLQKVPLVVRDTHISFTHCSDEAAFAEHENKICTRVKDMIARLPEPLRAIPVNDDFPVLADLYTFFTTLLPTLLPSLFNTSADKAGAIKVARALGKVKADGYRMCSDSETDSSCEASEASDSSVAKESDTESDDSTDAYNFEGIPALVCDSFLFDINNGDGDGAAGADGGSIESVLDDEQTLEQRAQQRRRLSGLRLHIKDLSLSGILLLQFKCPNITAVCSKCLRITMVILSAGTQEGATLKGSANCTGCGTMMSLSMHTLIFNNFSGGTHGAEALLVESHTSCFPIGLAKVANCKIICQCASCNNISEHDKWRHLHTTSGVPHIQSFCPICFCKLRLCYSTAKFELPNGSAIPLPKKASIQQKRQQMQTGPLPGNGTCKHASHSYRWFRFTCGLAYPCDTCHSKECACENTIASTQLCGFCGKESSVQPICPHCKKDLVHKKATHWEGGTGCRDKAVMSRKDSKKHSGSKIKTRSKKAEKRDEMRHRGNAKKKPGDRW